MSKLSLVKLRDLVDNFDNQRIPLSVKQRANLEKKYRYYGAQGVIDYVDDYIFDGEYILVAEDGENLKSQKSKICNHVTGKFWVNNHAHIIQAKGDNNTRYLYYNLNLVNFRNYVTGSAQPKLTKDNLDGIALHVHKGTDQKKIAYALTLVDQKIELNNRINTELEAMAKTLYDYWFIQFDFPFDFATGKPDINGKPYKSSGGKMIYNQTLKREIPEGWEVQSLRYHLNCNTEKLGKKHSYREINYLDTANLTDNQLDSIHKLIIGVDNIPSRANMIVSKNDILYSTVRPNLLHFGLIRKPVENMIASTGFSVLSSKVSSEYNSLFYQHLTADWNTKKLIKIAESSKSSYPSISPDDILNLNIALPVANDLIDNAVNVLNPVFDKISERQHENQELTALRDWLLPMLMNGQVTIKS